MSRFHMRVASIALFPLCLFAARGVGGQISAVNSAIVTTQEFSDVSSAIVNSTNSYPSLISFSEEGVSSPTGFANRDVWRFSSDGGGSAALLQNNDYFNATMDVTLTADPDAPRKEAGFLLDTTEGQGQFIVNTDTHEIVAFGGPLPFYAFPSTFNSGDTVALGITYLLDSNSKPAVIYSANGVQSPVLEFANPALGLTSNSTLGGYFQINNDALNAINLGAAQFANIQITQVPESSTAILAAIGCICLVTFACRTATP